MKHTLKVFSSIAAAALMLTACGSDDDDTADAQNHDIIDTSSAPSQQPSNDETDAMQDCTGAIEAYEQYDGNLDGVRMAMYDASADESESLLGAASDDMAKKARQDLWERHQQDREQCLPEETRTVQEQMDDMAEFIWNDPDVFPEGDYLFAVYQAQQYFTDEDRAEVGLESIDEPGVEDDIEDTIERFARDHDIDRDFHQEAVDYMRVSWTTNRSSWDEDGLECHHQAESASNPDLWSTSSIIEYRDYIVDEDVFDDIYSEVCD